MPFRQKILSITLMLLLSLFVMQGVIADNETEEKSKTPPGSTEPVKLINPLGGTTAKPAGTTDIPVLLGNIISSVLGVIGSLALVMFIYGGATWMLSAGNQERVTKGKQILIWATVGIIIIFSAYALVKFVLTTVTATG